MDNKDECSNLTLSKMLMEYFNVIKARYPRQSPKDLFEKYLFTSSFHVIEKIRLDSAHILSCLFYLTKISANNNVDILRKSLKNDLSSVNKLLKGLSKEGPDVLFQIGINSAKIICKENILLTCMRVDDNFAFASELFLQLFFVASNHPNSRCMLEDVMVNMLSKIEPNDPKNLLEVVLDHLLIKGDKTPEKQIAYELAQQVIRRAAFIFDSYIDEFIDSIVRIKDSRLQHFKDHIYDLIYELNSLGHFSSLLGVVRNLESILKKKTTAINIKMEIYVLLGKLFSKKNSLYQYELKSLWLTFIASFQDVNVDVRNCCIKFSSSLLLNHPNLTKDLEKQLSACAKNSQMSTRLEVVNAILAITKRNIISIDKPLLKILLKRASDKTFPVRKVALVSLCRVFIAWESNHRDLAADLTTILNKVLTNYHLSGIEDQILVEQLMRYYITPFEMPTEELVVRVCGIFTVINSMAKTAYKALLLNQTKIRQCLRSIIEFSSDQDNSKPIVLRHLSSYLPENPRSVIHLDKFSQLLRNDEDLQTHVNQLLNFECSWDVVDDIYVKEIADITKKLKNPELNESLHCINDITKQILQRSVLPIGIFDSHFISLLIKRINLLKSEGVEYFLFKQNNRNDNTAIERELELLHFVSNLNLFLFTSEKLHNELSQLLCSENTVIVKWALKIFQLLGGGSLENYCSMDFWASKWVNLAKVGNEKQLKYAIICLAHLPEDKREMEFSDLLKDAVESLNACSRNSTEILILIGHISFFIPSLFQESIPEFESFCLRFKDIPPPLSESREDTESEHVKIKVEFMKCITRYFIGSSKAKKCIDLVSFAIFINLLTPFFSASSNQKFNISKTNFNLLKVTAGSSVLKLATESGYSDFISNKTFRDLATLIESDDLAVKEQFAYKLNKLLMSLKLPMEYITLLILGVLEVDPKLSNRAKKYIIVNMNERFKAVQKCGLDASNKLQYPNNLLPYAIYLLAHHSTFTHYKQSQILYKFKNCLWLLMEPLIKVNNCDFLSEQLRRLKQAKIIESDVMPCEIEPMAKTAEEIAELHNKVYVLCDVCLGMLNTKAKSSSVAIKHFTINPQLPAKLFKFSGKLQRERNFLPANFSIKIPEDYNTYYKPDSTEVETSSENEWENSNERSRSVVETSSEEELENSNARSSLTTQKRSSPRANMTIPATKRHRTTNSDI